MKIKFKLVDDRIIRATINRKAKLKELAKLARKKPVPQSAKDEVVIRVLS